MPDDTIARRFDHDSVPEQRQWAARMQWRCCEWRPRPDSNLLNIQHYRRDFCIGKPDRTAGALDNMVRISGA